MSKGELWNILPYTGLWGSSPQCGTIKNLKTPPTKLTLLVGIPFSGDNTGANPNLRLISFYADRLDGPISTAGPRNTFFKSYLNYKISWRIETLDEETAESVQIGFYTAPYTVNSPGPDNMLLMLEENGPALYKANSCIDYSGCFRTSEVVDMFVVVDANVIVKLKIESDSPGELEVPCLNNLFKPYKYLSKCGELMATQFLVNNETGETLLRPAKKYVNTAKRMIDYLFATSVNIVLFENPTNTLNSVKNLAESGRLVVFFPFGNETKIRLSIYPYRVVSDYYLETSNFPPIPRGGQDGDGLGFTLFPEWGETNFKVHYTVSVEILPLNQNDTEDRSDETYEGFVELGKRSISGWDGFNNTKIPFPSIPRFGTTTVFSGILEPLDYPTFTGFKVGFDKMFSFVFPYPIVNLLYFAVEFF